MIFARTRKHLQFLALRRDFLIWKPQAKAQNIRLPGRTGSLPGLLIILVLTTVLKHRVGIPATHIPGRLISVRVQEMPDLLLIWL